MYSDSNASASVSDLDPSLPIAPESTALSPPPEIPETQAMEMIEADFERICQSCVGSKKNRTVQRKKMNPTKEKLEEVQADLWGPH